MLTCLDDSAAVTPAKIASGMGDSGLYYDALSLSQETDANFHEPLRISFEPTVFYRRGTGGLKRNAG